MILNADLHLSPVPYRIVFFVLFFFCTDFGTQSAGFSGMYMLSFKQCKMCLAESIIPVKTTHLHTFKKYLLQK